MRNKIYGMMNRWLDKGIDGFRMDVINMIAKKEGLPDAAGNAGEYVFAGKYFANQPKLHDFLKEMRSLCFDGRDCMCVGEAPVVDISTVTINVEAAMQDKDSILHYYRNLIALRSANPVLVYGDYDELLHEHEQIYAYTRTYEQEKWAVFCNMTSKRVRITLPAEFIQGEILLSNVKSSINEEIMLAYEALVIRLVKE